MNFITQSEYDAFQQSFTPDGYTYNNEKKEYVKIEKERTVYIRIIDQAHIPGSTVVFGVLLDINIHDVEDIEYEASKQVPYPMQIPTRKSYTLTYSPILTSAQSNLIKAVWVYSIVDLERFRDVISDLINQCVTFADTYKTLAEVCARGNELYAQNELLGTPESEKALLNFYRKQMPVKRIILKKLNNESDWESYLDEKIAFFSPSGSYVSPEHESFLINLKTYLLNL